MRHTSEDIVVSMPDYTGRICSVDVRRQRRGNLAGEASGSEKHQYKSLAGMILYFGQAVVSQAFLVVSKMQQRLGCLRIQHILDAYSMIRELRSLKTMLLFPAVSQIEVAMIITSPDAGHTSCARVFGQSGIMGALKLVSTNKRFYHPIARSSSKQKKVSYSSYWAEVLAAAEADERGYFLRDAIISLFPDLSLEHEPLVDSKSLFETKMTFHQTGDYRLWKILARMGDSFESKELNVVRWLPGSPNYSDVLTIRNIPL